MTNPNRQVPPRCAALLVVASLIVCFAVALTLRTAFVADRVLSDGRVLFQGQDAWYHARLIENTVHNFPYRLERDRLAPFPRGQRVDVGPFFDQLSAGVALVIGGGQPTRHQIHLVSAVLPAILGALIVFPMYGIGRVLYGYRFGLASAALAAVLPGSFLHRTSLGHADHHAAEAFLALMAVALTLIGIERAGRLRSSVGISIAAGVALLAYLRTFTGGALIVAILTLWCGAQLVRDRFDETDSRYLLRAVLPGLIVALIGTWFLSGNAPHDGLQRATLLTAVVLLAIVVPLARSTVGRRHGTWIVLLSTMIVGLAAMIGLRFLAVETWSLVTSTLGHWFRPTVFSSIYETEPLLKIARPFDAGPVWRQFASLGWMAPVGWFVIAHRGIRSGRPPFLLVTVWTAIALGLALIQVRFIYYAAPATALLAAAFCRQAIVWSGDPVKPGTLSSRMTAVGMSLLAFVPPLLLAFTAATTYSGPDKDWVATLDWLSEQTPSPVASSEVFNRTFGRSGDEPFRHDRKAYSVMNWWDDGYRILSAGRLPVAIPTQDGAAQAAAFYTAYQNRVANDVLNRMRSRYVVLDQSLPFLSRAAGSISGKFPQLAVRAGERPSRYYRLYQVPEDQGGGVRPLFRPAYYRSALVRLYLYGGRAVEPEASYVVSYDLVPGEQGPPLRRIRRLVKFDSVEEARAFIAAQPGKRHELVGIDPRNTCVPLRPLMRYREVYSSPTSIAVVDGRPVPSVRIFEFRPARKGFRP